MHGISGTETQIDSLMTVRFFIPYPPFHARRLRDLSETNG